jgi:hypothetical protein
MSYFIIGGTNVLVGEMPLVIIGGTNVRVGQMSYVIIGGTNVGVGQMSGGTNVRWEKCRSDKRRWDKRRWDKSRATACINLHGCPNLTTSFFTNTP